MSVPANKLVEKKHLRALLFWAAEGVRKSRGGSYDDSIQAIIEDYRIAIKMQPGDFCEYPVWFMGPKKVKK